MAKQNLGRVSVVPKGEYVGGATYTKLDIVTYNGSSYIALKDTSASPTDTTAWQLVAEKGETGKDGASTWDALTGKPFESVGDGLTVMDGVLIGTVSRDDGCVTIDLTKDDVSKELYDAVTGGKLIKVEFEAHGVSYSGIAQAAIFDEYSGELYGNVIGHTISGGFSYGSSFLLDYDFTDDESCLRNFQIERRATLLDATITKDGTVYVPTTFEELKKFASLYSVVVKAKDMQNDRELYMPIFSCNDNAVVFSAFAENGYHKITVTDSGETYDTGEGRANVISPLTVANAPTTSEKTESDAEGTDLAIGDSAKADGHTTDGNGTSDYISSVACGYKATASGAGSTASGAESTALGKFSTASGAASKASGEGSTASGVFSTASGAESTALGAGSTASGEASTASGVFSTASGTESTALGLASTASGLGSTASGAESKASGTASTASGAASKASGEGSVALGSFSTTSKVENFCVSVGGDNGRYDSATDTFIEGAFTRRIIKVSDPVNDTDAATMGWVKAYIASLLGTTGEQSNEAEEQAIETETSD